MNYYLLGISDMNVKKVQGTEGEIGSVNRKLFYFSLPSTKLRCSGISRDKTFCKV
jgi:hypothetical protein